MRALVAKRWATVAIIALLALNVVLIAPLIANRNDGSNQTATAETPVTPTAASPSPSASTPSPTPTTESPSADPALVSDKPRRLLAVNSSQIAWRAEAAGCGHDSKIEVTTDGGKTWRVTDSDLKSVVRLKAFGDSSVFAIGADSECNPVYSVDAAPGDTWQQDSSMLANTWFRVPNDLSSVHDPHGQTSQPCDDKGLVDMAGLGDTKAAALCSGGSVVIRNGGESWKLAAQNSHAVALSADDSRFVMVEENADCDGLAVRRFTLSDDQLKMSNKSHCFKVSDHSLSGVAVSNQHSEIWIWAGNDVKQQS